MKNLEIEPEYEQQIEIGSMVSMDDVTLIPIQPIILDNNIPNLNHDINNSFNDESEMVVSVQSPCEESGIITAPNFDISNGKEENIIHTNEEIINKEAEKTKETNSETNKQRSDSKSINDVDFSSEKSPIEKNNTCDEKLSGTENIRVSMSNTTKEEDNTILDVMGTRIAEKINKEESGHSLSQLIKEKGIPETTTDKDQINKNKEVDIGKNVVVDTVPLQEANNNDKNIFPSPFKSHLGYPEVPINKNVKKLKERMPSAISCKSWRQYYEKKDKIKLERLELAKKRREGRQYLTQAKKTKPTKKDRRNISSKESQAGPSKKKKENCSLCEEELDSEAEEDGEKNIGCDFCPRWYHLHCTEFIGLPYNEVKRKEYKCDLCQE